MNIFLDIETIPTQNPAHQAFVVENLSPPSNYKNQETIDKWLAENRESAILKTSLDGAFGEIVAIGVAIDDLAPICLYREDWQSADREADILKRFHSYLREIGSMRNTVPHFIGHNYAKFDERFIYQRSVINKVKPYYTPTRHNIFDTMTEWAGYGGTVSLAKLCQVLGIEAKGDIDGSKVWDYVQADKIHEVAEYCKADVHRVREVYKRMTFKE